jgi:small subunit ribosomal protein S25e
VIPQSTISTPLDLETIANILVLGCRSLETLSHRFIHSHRSLRIATDIPTVKDKANHAVVLDKQTNDKLQKDVQSYRLITVATLVDRLKINGSLARKALADLEANGQIKKVVGHSKLSIYSMTSHKFRSGMQERVKWTCANSLTARAVGATD